MGWGKRVTLRYANATRIRFFSDQFFVVRTEGRFAKGRVLRAAWKAGAPIGNLPLPSIGPPTPSPRAILDGLCGAIRRSVAARFFTGDLNLAAYACNWDVTRRYVPARSCAYCLLDIPHSAAY